MIRNSQNSVPVNRFNLYIAWSDLVQPIVETLIVTAKYSTHNTGGKNYTNL